MKVVETTNGRSGNSETDCATEAVSGKVASTRGSSLANQLGNGLRKRILLALRARAEGSNMQDGHTPTAVPAECDNAVGQISIVRIWEGFW